MEKSKDVIGVGVILLTTDGKYLLQERDNNTEKNPGRIAPFGGGLEGSESVVECAIREMEEELDLKLKKHDLQRVGIYESKNNPNEFIQMFIATGIDPIGLNLKEGRSVVETTLDDAMGNDRVTEFTKIVLSSLM